MIIKLILISSVLMLAACEQQQDTNQKTESKPVVQKVVAKIEVPKIAKS